MSETLNIYQKLIEVRKAVPYLKKGNKGHQFNYVSSSQTLGTVRAKMDEMGLLLMPSVINQEVRDHTTKNGGHEYFTIVDVKFTWVNAEKPEERIDCAWMGHGLDSGEKGVGKALTYAEKYFILKFFNIATDKDDPDSFQNKHNPPPATPEVPLDERFSKAIDWISGQGKKDITPDQFDLAVDSMRPHLNIFKGRMKKDIETTIADTRKFLEEKEHENN